MFKLKPIGDLGQEVAFSTLFHAPCHWNLPGFSQDGSHCKFFQFEPSQNLIFFLFYASGYQDAVHQFNLDHVWSQFMLQILLLHPWATTFGNIYTSIGKKKVLISAGTSRHNFFQ